jgi:tetratricopeptide (TPR) repeat protein
MVIGSQRDDLAARMLDFAANSPAPTLLFTMEEAATPAGWIEPLEAALSRDGVGLVFSASNAGLGPQKIEAGVRSMGRALAKFARKNALERRGMLDYINVGFPAAVAVRKETLLKHGLASEFQTAAILMELARSVSDACLGVVCAKDSYAHIAGKPSTLFDGEKAAVLALFAARESVEAGDSKAALERLDLAVASKPDYVEALYERGFLRALAGSDEDAARDFEATIRARPDDSRAYNNLGCILFKRGDAAGAESHFKQAFDVSSANWEAKKNLADLYMATERPKEAVDLYLRIIDEHRECPDAYLAMGYAFASCGDLETAEHLFRVASRLSPGSEEARRGLAVVDAAGAIRANTGDKAIGVKT